MIRQRQNGITYFQFESFPNGQSHAVFSRLGGCSPTPFDSLNLSVSVPDIEKNIYINRSKAYGIFGREQNSLVHAYLVRHNDVARVTSADYGQWVSRVDGIITNEPGCGLTMNYADCAPIFIIDPINNAIGLGHAGWEGAVKDLPGNLVQAMTAAFGSKPKTLIAGIGPCIGSCCYEVGEPVISQVKAAFANPDSLLISQGEGARPHFDLEKANVQNLRNAGIQQIETSGYCTGCRTDLFFSHRMEGGKTGRFGVMMILENGD